ncbi:hypothetical protein [Burkholderia multivorans]|uniref:hypothetical protein n=1 Tax=Burkholderia multivorans TaxID=87883 RepID=UPI001269F9E6|nr:hypothetical protein [Burkholderia multivorans]HDR9474410.1 hypothetical protein [Burkholderia multivorans]HDR9480252.1 hypothetical protein [Burkholderia multivorans]
MKSSFPVGDEVVATDVRKSVASPKRYSRIAAIAEREIVPVPRSLAEECRFRVPVALSSAAWQECVEWAECGTAEVLWDVLFAALGAIRAKTRRARSADFSVRRVATGASEAAEVPLRAEVEVDDDGKAALTIYLASE